MENKSFRPITYVEQGKPIKPIKYVDDNGNEIIDPEERTYVLLYYAIDDDGNDIKSFEVIIGRTQTYNFIKNMIEYLDIHESRVLVNNTPYERASSVYSFMKIMKMYYTDSFDIEDYNIGDDAEKYLKEYKEWIKENGIFDLNLVEGDGLDE